MMPYFKNMAEHDVQQKTIEEDIVTIADIETENALKSYLHDLFPVVDFLGEESYVARDDKTFLTGFVCDPIDGTGFFRDGVPKFGLMLSFMQDSELVRTWLYQPCSGDMIIAQKGEGVTLNGQKINASERKKPPLKEQALVGHFRSYDGDAMHRIHGHIKVNGLHIGEHVCASMDYFNFVRGTIDNIVYKNAYPWDMAAGALIVKELGGHAALLREQLDLNAHLCADIHAPVLFTRYRDDWAPLRAVLLSA
ncbi:MAG TPA: inositol monophosphatase family protein [Alphaproteobacteria bacterium]